MERKIGDTFPFRGVMLEIVEYEDRKGCSGCYAVNDAESCQKLQPCSGIIYNELPSFFDAYSALITDAERVAKLAETDEQRAVCDETIDRLIAMRARIAK